MALQKLHHPVLDRIMVWITVLGNGGWFFILLGVVLIINGKTRKIGIHVLVSLLFSAILCSLILKGMVARSRPCWIDPNVPLLIKSPRDYSFPSGHTSAAVAAACSVLAYNKKYGSMLCALAFCIAFSRMYLFVHFPTDILGGIVMGIFSAVLALSAIKYYEKRHPF